MNKTIRGLYFSVAVLHLLLLNYLYTDHQCFSIITNSFLVDSSYCNPSVGKPWIISTRLCVVFINRRTQINVSIRKEESELISPTLIQYIGMSDCVLVFPKRKASLSSLWSFYSHRAEIRPTCWVVPIFWYCLARVYNLITIQ